MHSTADSDLFMKVAQNAYAEHERSLIQCTKCKRKFFPDRIKKHQTNCAAEKLHSSINKSSKSQKKWKRFRQAKWKINEFDKKNFAFG